MIDKDRTIIDVVDLQLCKGLLPIDVVLMAGGKGERLRPITDNLPKPLVKVGDKEIIKRNIERLANFGVKNFNIALRHLSDKIIHSIEGEKYHHLLINYVKEEKALGTIGAVRLINSFYNNNIIVMNSDLLTNIDFSELYHTFVQEGADMAVATIPYYVNVPYAIMEIDQNNRIKTLNEKPRYTYYANAGIYLFRKEMQGFIPENQEFDATDFIETLISNGKKVISFPILSYWLDIGRLEEYYKAQEDIKHIQF
jgi:NDP-sugar pyrophosphorylase family protein